MQGDHLLSVAGVSEQAGWPRAHVHVHAAAKTHMETKHVTTRVLTEGSAGRTDSQLKPNSLALFFSFLFFLFFYSVCLSNAA